MPASTSERNVCYLLLDGFLVRQVDEDDACVSSFFSQALPPLPPLALTLGLPPCSTPPPARSSFRPVLLRSSSRLLPFLFQLSFESHGDRETSSRLSPKNSAPGLILVCWVAERHRPRRLCAQSRAQLQDKRAVLSTHRNHPARGLAFNVQTPSSRTPLYVKGRSTSAPKNFTCTSCFLGQTPKFASPATQMARLQPFQFLRHQRLNTTSPKRPRALGCSRNRLDN